MEYGSILPQIAALFKGLSARKVGETGRRSATSSGRVTVRIFGLFVLYTIGRSKDQHTKQKGAAVMKGYYNGAGYMGYVEGRWVLFASESDYREYMEE